MFLVCRANALFVNDEISSINKCTLMLNMLYACFENNPIIKRYYEKNYWREFYIKKLKIRH